MLILTRRQGESIMIGNDIKIMIVGVRSGQAQIGINAPKEIEVHREEVYERIKAEREKS